MLVKVNTSLAGADFDFRFGQEVEQEEFAARVGNGWETLCDPIGAKVVKVEETAVDPVVDETADEEPTSETTDAVPAAERRGRRK